MCLRCDVFFLLQGYLQRDISFRAADHAPVAVGSDSELRAARHIPRNTPFDGPSPAIRRRLRVDLSHKGQALPPLPDRCALTETQVNVNQHTLLRGRTGEGR